MRTIGFEKENQLDYIISHDDIVDYIAGLRDDNVTVEYDIYQSHIQTSNIEENKDKVERINIELHLDVPKSQEIIVKSNFIQKALTMWNQYIAILIPSFIVIWYLILGSAFKRNIIESREWDEISDARKQNSDSKISLS